MEFDRQYECRAFLPQSRPSEERAGSHHRGSRTYLASFAELGRTFQARSSGQIQVTPPCRKAVAAIRQDSIRGEYGGHCERPGNTNAESMLDFAASWKLDMADAPVSESAPRLVSLLPRPLMLLTIVFLTASVAVGQINACK